MAMHQVKASPYNAAKGIACLQAVLDGKINHRSSSNPPFSDVRERFPIPTGSWKMVDGDLFERKNDFPRMHQAKNKVCLFSNVLVKLVEPSNF
jgi:hypothetical protein